MRANFQHIREAERAYTGTVPFGMEHRQTDRELFPPSAPDVLAANHRSSPCAVRGLSSLQLLCCCRLLVSTSSDKRETTLISSPTASCINHREPALSPAICSRSRSESCRSAEARHFGPTAAAAPPLLLLFSEKKERNGQNSDDQRMETEVSRTETNAVKAFDVRCSRQTQKLDHACGRRTMHAPRAKKFKFLVLACSRVWVEAYPLPSRDPLAQA